MGRPVIDERRVDPRSWSPCSSSAWRRSSSATGGRPGSSGCSCAGLVAALTFLVVAILVGFVSIALFADVVGGLGWTFALIAFPTVPIAVGVAVLRYHLLEIDRIVSRTVGYAIVTGILAVVYARVDRPAPDRPRRASPRRRRSRSPRRPSWSLPSSSRSDAGPEDVDRRFDRATRRRTDDGRRSPSDCATRWTSGRSAPTCRTRSAPPSSPSASGCGCAVGRRPIGGGDRPMTRSDSPGDWR